MSAAAITSVAVMESAAASRSAAALVSVAVMVTADLSQSAVASRSAAAFVNQPGCASLAAAALTPAAAGGDAPTMMSDRRKRHVAAIPLMRQRLVEGENR